MPMAAAKLSLLTLFRSTFFVLCTYYKGKAPLPFPFSSFPFSLSVTLCIYARYSQKKSANFFYGERLLFIISSLHGSRIFSSTCRISSRILMLLFFYPYNPATMALYFSFLKKKFKYYSSPKYNRLFLLNTLSGSKYK